MDKSLSFRTINVDDDAEICIRFRADSFVESFGSADRFFRVDGEKGGSYLEGLRGRNRDWPGSCVHAWLDDEIVGQIEVRREQGHSNRAHVLQYYLRADLRGLGLGEQLDHARSRTQFRYLGGQAPSVLCQDGPATATSYAGDTQTNGGSPNALAKTPSCYGALTITLFGSQAGRPSCLRTVGAPFPNRTGRSSSSAK
jgi:hypothetical protein